MAQQVYGCKRGRLHELAGDLARLLFERAAATDCPCTPTAPVNATLSDLSMDSADQSGGASKALSDSTQHSSVQHKKAQQSRVQLNPAQLSAARVPCVPARCCSFSHMAALLLSLSHRYRYLCHSHCTAKREERTDAIRRGVGAGLPAGGNQRLSPRSKQQGEVACDFQQAGTPACCRTLVAPLRIKWLGTRRGMPLWRSDRRAPRGQPRPGTPGFTPSAA